MAGLDQLAAGRENLQDPRPGSGPPARLVIERSSSKLGEQGEAAEELGLVAIFAPFARRSRSSGQINPSWILLAGGRLAG
jgi:hypothetical protein